MKMRLAVCGLLLSMASIEGALAQKYSEGQVWHYKTRPGETGSLLRIAKIETHPKLGQVFHIGLVGLRVRSPYAEAGFTSEVAHFPVSRGTLDRSVTKLSRARPVFPDVEEGYAEWQRANGGVFTLSVAEIVSAVEETVQRGSPK